MIRVTVDVVAAKAGRPGIRVQNLGTGHEHMCSDVMLTGDVRVVQGESRDGAVVWIEAGGYYVGS